MWAPRRNRRPTAMKHPTILTALFLALVPPLCGQSPDPLSLLPERCHFVVQCPTWKSLLAGLDGTRVARLLADPKLVPAAATLGRVLVDDLKGVPEGLLPLLGTALSEHAALLTLGMDFADLGSAEPRLRAALVITPKDKDSALFGLLTGELPALLAKTVQYEDVVIDGVTFRQPQDAGLLGTAPVRVGDHVVVLFAQDGKPGLTRLFGERGQGFGPRRDVLPKGVVSAWVDLSALMTLVGRRLSQDAADDRARAAITKALELSGLAGLKSATWSVAARAPYLVDEYQLTQDPRQRGLSELILPGTVAPRLGELLPPDSQDFLVSPLALDRGYELVARVLETLAPMGVPPRAELEQRAAEFLKVRLKEDLLDALGGELLVVKRRRASTPAEDEEGDAEAPGRLSLMMADADGCYGFAVRDGAAFGAALEKVVRGRGLHAGRKSSEHQGVKVFRLDLFGQLQLHYCVTDQVFLLGLGAAGGEDLRAVLDQAAARKAGQPAPALRPTVAERVAVAGKDWHILNVANHSGIMGMLSSQVQRVDKMLAALGGEQPKTLTEMSAALATLSALFKEHQLEDRVSVTRRTPTGLQILNVW